MTASRQESKRGSPTGHSTRRLRTVPYRAVFLFGLLFTAVLLDRKGILDWRHVLRVGEIHAHTWWFPPSLILMKVVSYTFAFPGSAFMWVAGLLYHPWEATLIIVAGGLGGAVSAYFFSRKLSRGFSERVRASRFFRVIEKQGDFATLCAVRTLPSFPHSIINYSAGMLHIPLSRFALSTLIGFTAKGYVYATAMRLAATTDAAGDALSAGAVLPLLALGALFLGGKLLQRKFSRDPE